MSQYNDSGTYAVRFAEPISKLLRVNFDGTVGNATDFSIGTASAFGDTGQITTLFLFNKEGTQKMVASDSITKGEPVYGANAGKVTATQVTGSYRVGFAMADAVANDVFEVMPSMGTNPGT